MTTTWRALLSPSGNGGLGILDEFPLLFGRGAAVQCGAGFSDGESQPVGLLRRPVIGVWYVEPVQYASGRQPGRPVAALKAALLRRLECLLLWHPAASGSDAAACPDSSCRVCTPVLPSRAVPAIRGLYPPGIPTQFSMSSKVLPRFRSTAACKMYLALPKGSRLCISSSTSKSTLGRYAPPPFTTVVSGMGAWGMVGDLSLCIILRL